MHCIRNKLFYVIIPMLFIPNIYLPAQTCYISGTVKDSQTGESLIGVSIYDSISHRGASTNNFGFYSISFPANQEITLIISYIGYGKVTKHLFLTENIRLNFLMEQNAFIEEVVVTSEACEKAYEKNEMSVVEIPLKQLKLLPTLIGETDIMRPYQLMPGVQAGKEGSSALYVRGGSPDQNLILLDDIPLYYVNHIGGFISIFDASVIKSSRLIKGGFPARYGGRLSSVLDIRMNDGNLKKKKKEISVGVISSKLLIEGPLKKNKSSYLLSVRRCNLDLFTRLFDKLENKKTSSGYTFYDLYGKINYE